jgi:hypothetical protein
MANPTPGSPPPLPTSPPAASGNPNQPAPGSASRLAANLAAKHGAAAAAVKLKPPTKGAPGRATSEQEAARYLASRGLAAVPAGQAPPPALVAPETPQYVVTPEFVGEVSEKVCKSVEGYRVSSREHRVMKLCGDKGLSKDFGESSKAPPGCIETISKSMMEIARKYPTILQWTPEFAVLAAIGTWIAKDQDVNNRLTKLEQMVKDQLAGKAAPAPVAAPKG